LSRPSRRRGRSIAGNGGAAEDEPVVFRHRAGVHLLGHRLRLGETGAIHDVDLVTTLVTNIGAPCLVFHTLANLELGAKSLATMMAATLAVLAACAALGAAVLRLAGLPQRAYLPALVFPNTGNMGLPLCYLAFGDAGLALAIGVFTVYSAAQFTLGMSLASGTVSLAALARVPLLYAVPLALAFLLAGTPPPAWINATTQLLGGLTIPMMLITLGVSLASLGVGSLPRSLALAALRLVAGFVVGAAVAAVAGLDGAARSVLIVQATMPVAVFNYLFAARYNTAPAEVAGAVVLSTILSFATLPALLWYVL
jgi:predicted permease